MTSKDRLIVALVVWLHVLVEVLHGIAHGGAGVWPPLPSLVFVVLVIGIAPLAALSLLHTRWYQGGAWLLLLSMLGSLLFGIINHYLLPGADNVASIPAGSWQLLFEITGMLLVVTEGLGALAGVWAVYKTMFARAHAA